ncbi:MAG: DNA polymerase III subunit beta [Clostridia bacterium]|nr:DNA polymerase III subunit beta [Clostridia bacterium]
MKFVCSTAELSEACLNVQRAVSTKTSIPAVEGILIKALGGELILTGYDLELGITTSIDATIEENGSIIINARILCDILRKLPGDTVRFESDSRNLASIVSGNAKYSLIGMSADEYPELPSVSGGYPVVINQGLLKDMVRQTIFAVAVNDTKVVHTGVRFEIGQRIIKLIAVDGFRLAVRKEDIDYDGEDISFIVPAKTLSEIMKLMNDDDGVISLGIGKRHIVFDVDGYNIVSRLLEGEFLNYKSAIPLNCSTKVKVNTRDMIDSIDRASLIISEKYKSPIKCVFKDNIISLSSVTSLGTASDSVGAQIDGENVEIGFNNKYLTDALKVAGTDEVRFELNGSVSPIIILPPEGDNFLFLVLPVRIKSE